MYDNANARNIFWPREPDERAWLKCVHPVEGFDGGSISMTTVQIG